MLLRNGRSNKSPHCVVRSLVSQEKAEDCEETSVRRSCDSENLCPSHAGVVSQVSTSTMTCYGRFLTNDCNSAFCRCCKGSREFQLQPRTDWKKLRRKPGVKPETYIGKSCDMADYYPVSELVSDSAKFPPSNSESDQVLPGGRNFVDLLCLVKSLWDLCGKGVLLLLAVIAHLCNSFLCSSGLGSGSLLNPRLLLVQFAVLFSTCLFQLSDACSTRPSPKPRPPRPYWRVDETLPKYNCTKDYEELYCLNNGSCFMQMNIHDVPTPYCVCYGYYGRRCEYLDIEDRHLPTIQRQRIETAAISVAVTLLIMIAFLLSVAIYVYRRRMKYPRTVYDTTDSVPDRPFSIRRRDQLALRRPRRLEEGDVAGFEPAGASFEYIDSERKSTTAQPVQFPTEIAEVHTARASVV